MSAAKTKAQAIIDDNAVVVFSKSWCSYSRAAKQTLDAQGAKYTAVELDLIEDGSELQNALKDLTGQRTVPNIFINHEHIGGNSDLQSRRRELPELLKAAGAV